LIQKTCEEIDALIKEKKWSEAARAVVKLKYLDGVDAAAKAWTPSPESPT
jgi:DnaJ-domain-containing protein 1